MQEHCKENLLLEKCLLWSSGKIRHFIRQIIMAIWCFFGWSKTSIQFLNNYRQETNQFRFGFTWIQNTWIYDS